MPAQERPDGYPIHWIFDYFPRFTEQERAIALLLFDGKKVWKIAFELDLSTKAVEAAIAHIGSLTGWGTFMRLKTIESGTFFKKWGFIRKK